MTTNIKPVAWLCEYRSDEVFVSLAVDPMHDTDVRSKAPLYDQAALDAERAAERERWTTPVRALLISHDEGLRLLGEMMRARGVTSVTLPIDTREGFDAIEVLRGLLKE